LTKGTSRLGEDIARSGDILLTAAARASLLPRFENELEALSKTPFDDEPCYRLVLK